MNMSNWAQTWRCLCPRKSEVNQDIQREKSIECVNRGPDREIYHLCVKENEVKRDSDKESEIERVWPAVRRKE